MINNNSDDYANQRIGIFFVGFPSSLTGQCVSLAKWYIGEMCGIGDWQSARGNAKDFGDTLVNQGLAYIVNSGERRRGDLVVWKQDGGGYGHIGVLCSNDNVFEQNVGLSGTPSQNVPDGSGGYTKVYASRLDNLYSNWRVGQPTFYRMNGYKESTPIINNQGDEDMIDLNTLNVLFNLMLGRNPDADAINHYVGHYTTSFVVDDLNRSSERATRLANIANEQNNINASMESLKGSISTLSSELETERQKTASLAGSVSELTTRLDDSNKLNDELQKNIDTMSDINVKPSTEPVNNAQANVFVNFFMELFNKIFKRSK